jgi:hypothetical protein
MPTIQKTVPHSHLVFFLKMLQKLIDRSGPVTYTKIKDRRFLFPNPGVVIYCEVVPQYKKMVFQYNIKKWFFNTI